jgi:hypothetical protein
MAINPAIVLKNTAKTLEQPEYVSVVKSIIDQNNADSFTILFARRYNTGKSTLPNKPPGRTILKTFNGETAKTLAWLQYAKEGGEWACHHDFEDAMRGVTLDEIAAVPYFSIGMRIKCKTAVFFLRIAFAGGAERYDIFIEGAAIVIERVMGDGVDKIALHPSKPLLSHRRLPGPGAIITRLGGATTPAKLSIRL